MLIERFVQLFRDSNRAFLWIMAISMGLNVLYLPYPRYGHGHCIPLHPLRSALLCPHPQLLVPRCALRLPHPAPVQRSGLWGVEDQAQRHRRHLRSELSGHVPGKNAGIEEGKNLKVEYQNAQTDTGTASTIADSFVSEKVDMICAIATPCAASAMQFSYECRHSNGIHSSFRSCCSRSC